ncbi:hypothetical protein [Methylobacterium sp. AMS5]|uniref:hypothetical protein n=1 Tax=Methylobacterium sp. AMS5 TaxID=925818 RepID=UPI00074F9EBD|nr:hypothetical protein [Methylobacterium sp. AMS5]AMB48239.1 hypothetical protein Y590_25055 [Methylobacterium sp. AMS5]
MSAEQVGEEIFGLDTPLDKCHDIMLALGTKAIEPERWLMNSKWFDYRFMNPVHATYLFADHYRNVYKRVFRETMDSARGEYVKGIKAQDPFDMSVKNSDRMGLWKARQFADGLGMPYDLFIAIAMHWSLRKCKKDYLPRPTHLYNFDLLTAVSETWGDRQKGILYVAKDARFKNEAYAGSPIQDAHHEWIFEQIGLRSNPARLIYAMIHDEQLLPEAKARGRIDPEVMQRVDDLH